MCWSGPENDGWNAASAPEELDGACEVTQKCFLMSERLCGVKRNGPIYLVKEQVWLSVGNGIVTVHGSVATDDLAQKAC